MRKPSNGYRAGGVGAGLVVVESNTSLLELLVSPAAMASEVKIGLCVCARKRILVCAPTENTQDSYLLLATK